MTKERVIEVLSEIVDTALNTKGIDDDAEYMNEILEAEEYMRECVRNFTPDPIKIATYVKENLTGLTEE